MKNRSKETLLFPWILIHYLNLPDCMIANIFSPIYFQLLSRGLNKYFEVPQVAHQRYNPSHTLANGL